MKTKKVRIAVAINGDGEYGAVARDPGGKDPKDHDEELIEDVLEIMTIYDGPNYHLEHVVFVEAEVQIPERVVEVKGEVVGDPQPSPEHVNEDEIKVRLGREHQL